MNTEIFKDIPGLEGRYSVSNRGRVYSRISKKFLKPKVHRNGYLHLILYRPDGTWKDEYIHRLVAKVFCEKKEGCNVVNHLDGDKQNNNASNLEWTTNIENVIHGFIHSLGECESSKRINVYKNGVFIGTLDGTGWSFENEAELHPEQSEEVMVSDEDTA